MRVFLGKQEMKRILAGVLTALLFGSSLISPLSAEAAEPKGLTAGNENYIRTEYDGFLIGMPEGWDVQLFSEQLSWLRGSLPEAVCNGIYWVDSLEIVEKLKRLGLIDFFEPNYYVSLFDEAGDGSNGWGYETLAAGYTEAYGLTGSGIRIGVIDSGVDRDNLNLQNANLLQGYNYVSDNGDTADDLYHGTKVTQVICADHNGLGTGGIAPDAEIVPLKCFSSTGGGTVRVLLKAIEDAVYSYGCDIINMSWGLSTNSELLHNQIQDAYEAGVILVAAAGNVTSKYPQGTIIYPAAYDEVISVSAINSSLQVLSSSQQNDRVFVCAPGGGIPFVREDGSVAGDSGTSFAAPCVTAEIALLRELDGNLDRDVMRELMMERAVDLADAGYDTASGYGLLPLDRLIGQHWSRFSVTGDAGQGTRSVSVSGWTLNHGGSRGVLTAYDANGQMIGIRILATDLDRGLFDHTFTEENAASYMIAYLNTAFVPLDSCDRCSP